MAGIRFDFNKFDKAGLKDLLAAFKKAGHPVKDVSATNRPKREMGFQVKTAVLEFDDGQKLQLKMKANGSIFQVRLNSKVIPVKAVDDPDKAVKEIAEHVSANSTAFAKAQQKRLEKQKIKVPVIAIRTTRKKQIEEFEARIAEVSAETEGLSAELAEASATLETRQGERDGIQGKLEAARIENDRLREELASLKAAA